jgi:hypothetical protein
MILNIILLISSLLATVCAQCPSYWWPMSAATKSVNFFTEVMSGDHITNVIGPAALATFYVSGDRINTATPRVTGFGSLSLAVTNGLIATPDTYFCSGSFSISAWILGAAATTTVIDFRDSTNLGVQFTLALALTLQINAQTAATSAVAATSAWNFVAVTYTAGTGTSTFFAALQTAGSLTAGTSSATFMTTAPSCTVITRPYIAVASTGAAALPGAISLNDIKIYNFALSNQQMQNRYTAEYGNFFIIIF